PPYTTLSLPPSRPPLLGRPLQRGQRGTRRVPAPHARQHDPFDTSFGRRINDLATEVSIRVNHYNPWQVAHRQASRGEFALRCVAGRDVGIERRLARVHDARNATIG